MRRAIAAGIPPAHISLSSQELPADFAELVEQTLHLVRPEAKEADIQIVTETSGLDPVYGSRVQIAQVVVNLLRNACEAVASGPPNEKLIICTQASFFHFGPF